MPHAIRILPEELCNKIAAGEVVERPASVVKELIENSLDADATEILVDIDRGGRKLIRLRDNGHGMLRDDAFLSLERHATSKIRHDGDLFGLSTLGFRGEALPSIASVSRFRLKTCAEGETVGTEISVEGGTVKAVQEVGFPRGTQIEVRNLFFNTPARRKFLRKEETEIGHIADVVTKQALANPDVRFVLKHNDRVLIEARSEKDLRSRVAFLLGRSLEKSLIELQRDSGEDLRLHGLMGNPALTRATTGAIYTYINGRYVRDKVVQHAILDGYRHLLMRGRYPVVVLFVEMDPAQVDINVHPTKHEVRFRQQRQVHDFIATTLRDHLRSYGGNRSESVTIEPTSQWASVAVESPATPAAERTEAFDFSRSTVCEPSASYGPPEQNVSPQSRWPAQPVPSKTDRSVTGDGVAPAEVAAAGSFQRLRYLGQFQGTYLIAEDGADLVLIDQHAAHERVTYERLKAQLHRGAIEKQALLFPQIIEMDFRAAVALAEQCEVLHRLGFDLEPFGGKAYRLTTLPALLGEGDAEQLLQDVALELRQFSGSSLAEEALESVLVSMACHRSVRAHQVLTTDEVKALFIAMDSIDFSAHCPHGRPVMQRLSCREIEKMFKRL